MLDAICTLTDQAPKPYSVFAFQKLSDAEIELYRQSLTCPVCEGKAYYRKASSDGKAACFGSRYHQLDCSEFTPSAQKQREEQDAIEVNQLLVESDALHIDFSLSPRAKASKRKAPVPISSPEPILSSVSSTISAAMPSIVSSKPDSSQTAEQSADSDTDINVSAPSESQLTRVARQGLEKLLNSLLRGSDLASSDVWVYTDAERKYRWRAKNLFVNFADAEPVEGHKPRMYWGTISHADKQLAWLNPADSKDIGIPIADYQARLFKRFGLKDKRDVEGAGIILFGKCFWNKDKTRKIIQLWQNDLSRVFISKAEDA